ncbi:transposase [bacterium]|nr:transposase [bacterium]
MTQYRRLLIPGATYFFTVRLERRGDTLLTDHIESLRYAYARTVQDYPVTCHAMVVLPDHLHAVWTEPEGGVWYSERWRGIKARFSHAIPDQGRPRQSLADKREKGIWQRRFYEHAIRNPEEFRRALDHCEMNPVRHGLVAAPALWPYSSFARGRISEAAELARLRPPPPAERLPEAKPLPEAARLPQPDAA